MNRVTVSPEKLNDELIRTAKPLNVIAKHYGASPSWITQLIKKIEAGEPITSGAFLRLRGAIAYARGNSKPLPASRLT